MSQEVQQKTHTPMARFYNCVAELFHYWFAERTVVVRTYESSYGGIIQVVVPDRTYDQRK